MFRTLAITSCLALACCAYAQDKPRVFVSDSNSWQMTGAGGGSAGAFAASSAGGARPQTAEIIKTFGQRCPAVTINGRKEAANYVVVLEHEGGKGLLAHKDKIAVFEQAHGDVVFTKSTLSVGGSVQDACAAITSHWSTHATELKAAATPPPPAPAVAAAVVQTSASSAIGATLVLTSTPAGADIEINGNFVGTTPSTIQVSPGDQVVHISKKGYADYSRTMRVTGGSINLAAELDPTSAAATAASSTASGTQH